MALPTCRAVAPGEGGWSGAGRRGRLGCAPPPAQDASEPSADQTASLISGVSSTPLMAEQALHPLRRPGACGRIVDVAKRLERQSRRPGPDHGTRHPGPAWRREPSGPCRRHRSGRSVYLRNCRIKVASSTDLPAPVGPTTSAWPTSPTWVVSRNGRRPLGAGDEQRGPVQMLVALRSGPHRRERHQVSQVQGRDDGLAYVGVDVARNGGGAMPPPRSASPAAPRSRGPG